MAHDDKGIAYWKTAVHEVHEDLLLAWIQQEGVANVADPMGWCQDQDWRVQPGDLVAAGRADNSEEGREKRQI